MEKEVNRILERLSMQVISLDEARAEMRILGLFDAIGRSEQFTPKQLFILAHKYNMADFIKILKEAPTWKG